MSVLIKSSLMGGIQLHDVRKHINTNQLTPDFEHAFAVQRQRMFQSKSAIFTMNTDRKFEVTVGHIKYRSPKTFYRLLEYFAGFVHDETEIDVGDKVVISLQRRSGRPYVPNLPPYDIIFPDSTAKIAIVCIDTPNTVDNLYSFRSSLNSDENLTRELSPGYMIFLSEPSQVVMTPSAICSKDPFINDAYEDNITLTFLKRNN